MERVIAKDRWLEVPRSVIERTAHIIGDSSAAALALKEADSHDGPVRFYQTPNHSLIVEKLPKETTL